MLGVQSLPYAATLVTASISALSNKKAQATALMPEPVLTKAA
jgi:hypothetical protein